MPCRYSASSIRSLEHRWKALGKHIHHTVCEHGIERWIIAGAPVGGYDPRTKTVFQYHSYQEMRRTLKQQSEQESWENWVNMVLRNGNATTRKRKKGCEKIKQELICTLSSMTLIRTSTKRREKRPQHHSHMKTLMCRFRSALATPLNMRLSISAMQTPKS